MSKELESERILQRIRNGEDALCPRCSAKLKVSPPGWTPNSEIPLHLVQCPESQNHFLVHFYSRPDGFWEEFHAQIDAVRTCSVFVRASADTPELLAKHWVYIDGNVARTALRDESNTPAGTILVKLPPGEHRIVVRGNNPRNPDRPESNTIDFALQEKERADFEVTIDSGLHVKRVVQNLH